MARDANAHAGWRGVGSLWYQAYAHLGVFGFVGSCQAGAPGRGDVQEGMPSVALR